MKSSDHRWFGSCGIEARADLDDAHIHDLLHI
jgi:hypothetical protein